MPVIEAREVWKEFVQPGQNVVALSNINLVIEAGEFVVITGESGSGKSTLLSLIGALDSMSQGSIRLLGESLEEATPGRLARIRRDSIGFVFQDFRLIRHLSAIDNVRLPLLFSGCNADGDLPKRLIDKFQLDRRKNHRPDALSRGEMQRIALARALVNQPKILLADEPTANLDRLNSKIIWDHLKDLNRSSGLTVVVATHLSDMEEEAGRLLRLEEGKLVSNEAR